MIEIDEAFVDLAAPNANAIKNGRGLARKNKFLHLYRSEDETLLFGECKGSGKSNYHCSSDFIAPEKPVHRCSCPSRQFPCKHCLGLMYAHAMGREFKVGEVPEDVARKREKIEKRAENKKKRANKPRKVNKSALKKKIKVQLDGLDMLETLTRDLIRAGLGNINAKSARQIEERAKQPRNVYLTGAQNALYDFTSLFYKKDDIKQELDAREREAVYSEALDRLTRLESLCRRGRVYLNNPREAARPNCCAVSRRCGSRGSEFSACSPCRTAAFSLSTRAWPEKYPPSASPVSAAPPKNSPNSWKAPCAATTCKPWPPASNPRPNKSGRWFHFHISKIIRAQVFFGGRHF